MMGIFKEQAPQYRAAGFEPRPLKPGTKACKHKGWNQPDSELPSGTMDDWLKNHPNDGIGLRLGTLLPDGTQLAALDIDDNRYVRAASFLLGDPPCGRIGKKGIAFFVRLRGTTSQARSPFDVKLPDSSTVHVGELLGPGALIVIPPTIHPDTNQPYRWVGNSILDTDLNELPILEV